MFLQTTWTISLVWGLAFAGLTPAAWYPGHVQQAAQAAARPAK